MNGCYYSRRALKKVACSGFPQFSMGQLIISPGSWLRYKRRWQLLIRSKWRAQSSGPTSKVNENTVQQKSNSASRKKRRPASLAAYSEKGNTDLFCEAKIMEFGLVREPKPFTHGYREQKPAQKYFWLIFFGSNHLEYSVKNRDGFLVSFSMSAVSSVVVKCNVVSNVGKNSGAKEPFFP